MLGEDSRARVSKFERFAGKGAVGAWLGSRVEAFASGPEVDSADDIFCHPGWPQIVISEWESQRRSISKRSGAMSKSCNGHNINGLQYQEIFVA
jgi:hypothetical protein